MVSRTTKNAYGISIKGDKKRGIRVRLAKDGDWTGKFITLSVQTITVEMIRFMEHAIPASKTRTGLLLGIDTLLVMYELLFQQRNTESLRTLSSKTPSPAFDFKGTVVRLPFLARALPATSTCKTKSIPSARVLLGEKRSRTLLRHKKYALQYVVNTEPSQDPELSQVPESEPAPPTATNKPFDSREKQTCNRIFAKAVQASNARGDCAVLDAQDAASAFSLRNAGIDPTQVSIINWSPTTLSTIVLQPHVQNMNFHLGAASSFIGNRTAHSVRGIFLDYCSTWRGSRSRHTSPEQDVHMLFERQVLAPGAILGLTICRRGSNITTETLTEHIKRTGSKYGYDLDVQSVYTYRTMCFLCFEVDTL